MSASHLHYSTDVSSSVHHSLRSFYLSPKETSCGTKKPRSSTEAKPEITAPTMDAFPPLLPPATACNVTINAQTLFQPITSLIKLCDFSMTS